MLSFFRRIRKGLINTGAITKYALYAAGEVLSVMIGILLALSINNWNEEKINKKLEFEIINEIESNLQFDLSELQADIYGWTIIDESFDFIIDYVTKNTHPNQYFSRKASSLRLTPHFEPNISGYTLLSSKGVERISNDSLRKSITILYETKYPYYLKYEAERIQYRLLYTMPKIEHYFVMIPDPESKNFGDFKISQQDYEALRNDPSFFKMMNAMIYENSVMLDKARRTENEILGVLEQLTKVIE